MNNTKRKILALVMLIAFIITTVPLMAAPAYAADWSYQLAVKKNKNYNKGGNFYVSYSVTSKFDDIELRVQPTLYNSQGKAVVRWQSYNLAPGKSVTRGYGYNYAKLAGGKYTFKLNVSNVVMGTLGVWSTTINNNRPKKISFKSYQKVLDSKGRALHKFSVACTNMITQALTHKIYDAKGNLVYQIVGPKRKTNNEIGWFTWSGWSNVGKSYKCKSGNYTVQVTGGGLIIEKTYKLNIF